RCCRPRSLFICTCRPPISPLFPYTTLFRSVIGAGNDELVRLDVLVEHELPGLRTLDPEILRRLAAREVVANFRPDDVGNPVHGPRLSSIYMDRRRSPGNRGCAPGNA